MPDIVTRLRGAAVPTGLRWGVGLALATAVVSGVSVFVNGWAVKLVPDPAVYTTLKNGVAAVILAGLAAATVRPADLRGVATRSWLALPVVAVIGGSVPFLLFFTGLAEASTPAAAFIHKTLFVWVALLAAPLLGERLGWPSVAALGVLLAGQVLVAPPRGVVWGGGETLIALATLLWAAEAIIVRHLLGRTAHTVPTPVAAVARLGLGLVVLAGFLGVTGRWGSVGAIAPIGWLAVVLTGALLSAYVATWYAALRRAPASLVASVLVVGAPITALLQALTGASVPAPSVLAGEGLIVAGALLMAWFALRAVRDRRALELAGPLPRDRG